MSKKLKKKIIVGLLILLSVVIYNKYLSGITPQSLRAWINGYGSLAPIAYILAWAILPIFFFPVPVLALGGGLSFGIVAGTIYTMIGAMINSTLMFWIANLLAKDMVTAYLQKTMPVKWWNKFMIANKKDGFLIIFICRLIPLMPYNVINYASGLTQISFLNYSLATFLGILPGTLIFLNVGDKILDIHSPEFILSIIMLAGLILISAVLGKIVSKRVK